MMKKVMNYGGGREGGRESSKNSPMSPSNFFLCSGGSVVVDSQYICVLSGEGKFM